MSTETPYPAKNVGSAEDYIELKARYAAETRSLALGARVIDALRARLAAAEEQRDEARRMCQETAQSLNDVENKLEAAEDALGTEEMDKVAAEARAERAEADLRYTLAWFDKPTLAEFRQDAVGARIFDAAVAERPEP